MRWPKCRTEKEAARGLPNLLLSSWSSDSYTRAHQHSIAGLQLLCLLQFPGSSTGTVCLEATLRPSAALHIWQAFHQANLSEANVVYLADIWEGATEQFVKTYWRQAGQLSPLQIAVALQEAKPSIVMCDSSCLGTTHATHTCQLCKMQSGPCRNSLRFS